MLTYEEMKGIASGWLVPVCMANKSRRNLCGRLEQLRAKMENVGAVRYDKTRVSGGDYTDHLPELVDAVAETKAKIAKINADYREELTLLQELAKSPAAIMAINHYGYRRSWYALACKNRCSIAKCRVMADHGLIEIYEAIKERAWITYQLLV